MFAPVKRMAALTLAACGVMIVGCDDTSAGDKAVQDKLQRGTEELARVPAMDYSEAADLAKPVADMKPGRDLLVSAVGEKAAGLVWHTTAAGSLGDAELQAAHVLQIQLNNTTQQVHQTLADLRVLTQQVALTNYLASGYEKYDPKAQLAQLGAAISDIQGAGDKAVWAAAGGTVNTPTLSATKAQIAKLDGEIAQRKSQIAALETERSGQITAAEKKFEEAKSLKGDIRVKVFTEGAEARRKSEELAVNIDLTQDQLSRLEADLALAKGQETSLAAGIASLQDQQKAIEAGWTATQEHIANQRKIAGVILNGDDATTITIKAKVAKLNELNATAKAQRATLTEKLDEALKAFKDAADTAKKFGTSPQVTKPGGSNAAWKAIRENIHTNRYSMQVANVLRQQGSVQLNHAALLNESNTVRAQAQTTLSGAGLSGLDEWVVIEGSELTGLVNGAEEKLKESLDTLLSVVSGDTPPAVANASLISRLITLYQLIELQNQKKALQLGGDAQTYESDAEKLKAEIIAANLTLPALPGKLGIAPPPSAAPAPAAPEAAPAAPAAPAPADAAPAAPAAPAPDAAPAEPAAPAAPAEGGM